MELTFACLVWAAIFACLTVLAWLGDTMETM